MIASDQIIEQLIAGGMTPAAAGVLLARATVEMGVNAPSKGALRTRKWRAGRASQTVTNRHAVTPENPEAETSQTVTERHKPSPSDGAHISTSSFLDTPIKESPKKEESLDAPRSKRASRLPDDWQPNENNIAFALKLGIARDRIPTLAEKFRNHWHAKSKDATSPNWDARWRTWCMNDVEWNGKNGQHRQSGGHSSGKGLGFSGLALQRARAAGQHG